MAPAPLTDWMKRYDPTVINAHPDFRILDPSSSAEDAALLQDKANKGRLNLACTYNADKVMRLVRLPMPQAGEGDVLVRVRATGICGHV